MHYPTPADYDLPIKPVFDKASGYLYFWAPNHPLASSGRVYHHRHVASVMSGRWLVRDDVVHHVNENRSDNREENLEITSRSEHATHHGNNRKGQNNRSVKKHCPACQAAITVKHKKYCSRECSDEGRNVLSHVSKEDLQTLVKQMPVKELATHLGVARSSITIRCKVLELEMPGRGHWIIGQEGGRTKGKRRKLQQAA